MKKLIIILAALATVPAHAISDSYRAQLLHSGCNQATVSQGCDIHKTKAQNAAHAAAIAHSPAAKMRKWLDETAVGAPADAVADSLLAQGWKHSQGEWIKKGQHIQLTVDGGKVVAANLY